MSLFDKYVHGLISVASSSIVLGMAVAGLSGAALLDALNLKFAAAQQVAPTDARLRTESVEIPAPGYGKARGYLVQPVKAPGKLPGVLVVHENRGLNPHIEDVARRVALENFVAFAPDALFRSAAIPATRTRARELFQQARPGEGARGLRRRARYLKALPDCTARSASSASATAAAWRTCSRRARPDLAAAVPFYGSRPTSRTCRRSRRRC